MATTRRATPAPTAGSDLSLEELSTPEVQELPAVITRQEVALTDSEDNFLMKLIKSGKLPGHVRTVEDAFAIGKMGKELGFPIMSAFHNIIPISGKLTLTAKAQNALMRRAGITMELKEDALFVYRDGSTSEYPKVVVDPVNDKPVDRRTSILFTRNGVSEIVKFTWIDATEQGLTTKDNWIKLKRDMLYARCVSRGANRIATDVTMGLYTTDEMVDSMNIPGIQVTRDEDGTIASVITPHTVVPNQAA